MTGEHNTQQGWVDVLLSTDSFKALFSCRRSANRKTSMRKRTFNCGKQIRRELLQWPQAAPLHCKCLLFRADYVTCTVTCRVAPKLCDCALSLHGSHPLVLTFTNTNSHGSHAQKCYNVFIRTWLPCSEVLQCVHIHMAPMLRSATMCSYSIIKTTSVVYMDTASSHFEPCILGNVTVW
jgi:hypothetical protein